MKGGRSIVRRSRNDSPTCWKMPNFAELSDRISVQAKLGGFAPGLSNRNDMLWLILAEMEPGEGLFEQVFGAE